MEILTDNSQIKGQIYIIENKIDAKAYIGQTLSHRKNKDKYRPFGIIGRFNDHISEALCNTKRKQCWYLNNAIRKYGKEHFTVRLVQECSVDELDKLEQKYIQEYNSLYPNGYNLTKGGKTLQTLEHEFSEDTNTPSKRGGSTFRSQETRALMSKRLKEFSNKTEEKIRRSTATKEQHLKKKLKLFEDVTINAQNLESYLYYRKDRVVVRVQDKRVDFTGKHETQESLKERALEFLCKIATLPNCSGKPLEP